MNVHINVFMNVHINVHIIFHIDLHMNVHEIVTKIISAQKVWIPQRFLKILVDFGRLWLVFGYSSSYSSCDRGKTKSPSSLTT